jgi:hypothetical protein
LGIPFSRATCADDLTDYDWYVVTAMTEAKELMRQEREKKTGAP